MADKQLEFLKSKVSELAQKHRTIVSKLKDDLKQAMEIASREKMRAMNLENKLDDEKRRYYALEAQKASNPSVDSTKEIMELKSALNAEIQKSTMLANQLKEIAMDSNNIESLKDTAYLKATIIRLETDLKAESERTARIKTDAKEKLELLIEKHELEIKTILKTKKEVETHLAELQNEIDSIKSTSTGTNEFLLINIKNLENQNNELKNSIEEKNTLFESKSQELKKAIDDLNSFQLKYNEQIKDHEENSLHFHKLIKEQENELDRLSKVADRFDIIAMDRQVRCLKDEVLHMIKTPSQPRLKITLQNTIELKKRLKRNIEHLDEFTLNTLQEVDEIENLLRNHIFMEKENN
ncbi:MAG: hypothetical protein A2328_09460 [Bdellovibrionales bacterium RIFOXYB2_FULL_36_6]|nr:MAG: hypothetical protein A2328_09460 [Bdellovibrionales bacterium RIFOXYB2_FULL_36_6]